MYSLEVKKNLEPRLPVHWEALVKKIDLNQTAAGTKIIQRLLSGVSELYSIGVDLRLRLYEKKVMPINKLPRKVISIGNVVMGGTGKTPFTMHIARLLDQMGYNVCILSRGYKGRAEKSGGMVSDGHRLLMNALQAGDEAFLMASRLPSIPIAVGRNRIKSGIQVLRNQDIDVFLLDDGFQHLKLFRDLDIVILDKSVPFGNGLLFPRGPLRESSKALSRADVIVLTDTFNQSKVASDPHPPLLNAMLQTKPVFNAVHKPYISRFSDKDIFKQPECGRHFLDDLTLLFRKSIVAFAGLASNDRFLVMLKSLSTDVIHFFHFSDHHVYKITHLQPIIKAADEGKADFIVTTEKDFVKLPPHLNWPSRLLVLGVETVIDKNQDELAALLDNKLRITEKNI